MIDKDTLISKIEALQQELDKQTNAYDYEKTFDEKWKEITHEVFQGSLGVVPQDRNKKNSTE